ncbi:hypothetical protein [Chryseobacterium wanjuense]
MKPVRTIIVSYIEVILNYSNRFYKRQFITRKAVNNPIIVRFENVLNTYYNDNILRSGMPSVKYFSDQLNVSSGYLSDFNKSISLSRYQEKVKFCLFLDILFPKIIVKGIFRAKSNLCERLLMPINREFIKNGTICLQMAPFGIVVNLTGLSSNSLIADLNWILRVFC